MTDTVRFRVAHDDPEPAQDARSAPFPPLVASASTREDAAPLVSAWLNGRSFPLHHYGARAHLSEVDDLLSRLAKAGYLIARREG